MKIKEKIITTLHQASTGLKQLQDEFFIYGSAAMILSEVKIKDTEDVDIMVSNRDAILLKEIWKSKDLNIIPKESVLFHSDLSRYKFEYMDVEITGGLEVCKNGEFRPFVIYDYETIPVGDLLIKIPTLYEQKSILHFFGREKDLEKMTLVQQRIDFIEGKK